MQQNLPILLVGTGPMALEYARVLAALGLDFVVSSRDLDRARACADSCGAGDAIAHKDWGARPGGFEFAIVATSVESLAPIATDLLASGIQAILLEKPGSLGPAEARDLAARVAEAGALVRVAYNRRYYASVLALKALLAKEEPACAFFDFTEWSFRIADLQKGPGVKERWAEGNSAHVVDALGHLLGPLRVTHATIRGQGELAWHPAGATFVGMGACGETPVSWCTSWVCPGRWNIEVMTRQGRYKLSPMERLQVMRTGSVDWKPVEVDYDLDERFKPGLYRMVAAFRQEVLGAPDVRPILPTTGENAALLETITAIVGYES